MNMGRSWATDTIDTATKYVASSLRPLGYKKRGRTMVKHTNDGGVVVHVQAARDNDELLSRFTVNLGVRQERLQGVMDWAMRGKSLRMSDCIVQQRIGDLMDVSRDFWWLVEPQMSVKSVALEVVEAVQQHGVPFLNNLESWEKSREYILKTQGPFRAFFVYVLEERYSEAREAFLELKGPNAEIMVKRARRCADKVGLVLPKDLNGDM